MGWNFLSILKLQRCNHWSLGMEKQFHPWLYIACDYLPMLGLKLNHVSKGDPIAFPTWSLIYGLSWSGLMKVRLACVFQSQYHDCWLPVANANHYSFSSSSFRLTLNMLNCFKDDKRYLHFELYHGFDQSSWPTQPIPCLMILWWL